MHIRLKYYIVARIDEESHNLTYKDSNNRILMLYTNTVNGPLSHAAVYIVTISFVERSTTCIEDENLLSLLAVWRSTDGCNYQEPLLLHPKKKKCVSAIFKAKATKYKSSRIFLAFLTQRHSISIHTDVCH